MSELKENRAGNSRSASFKSPRAIWLDRVIAMTIIVAAIIAASFGFRGMPQINRSKVFAKSYIAPKGCEVADYETGDRISRACLVSTTAIIEPQIKGLTNNGLGRGKQWFRVGDDALNVFCGFGTSDCTVYDAVHDKFKVIS